MLGRWGDNQVLIRYLIMYLNQRLRSLMIGLLKEGLSYDTGDSGLIRNRGNLLSFCTCHTSHTSHTSHTRHTRLIITSYLLRVYLLLCPIRDVWRRSLGGITNGSSTMIDGD